MDESFESAQSEVAASLSPDHSVHAANAMPDYSDYSSSGDESDNEELDDDYGDDGEIDEERLTSLTVDDDQYQKKLTDEEVVQSNSFMNNLHTPERRQKELQAHLLGALLANGKLVEQGLTIQDVETNMRTVTYNAITLRAIAEEVSRMEGNNAKLTQDQGNLMIHDLFTDVVRVQDDELYFPCGTGMLAQLITQVERVGIDTAENERRTEHMKKQKMSLPKNRFKHMHANNFLVRLIRITQMAHYKDQVPWQWIMDLYAAMFDEEYPTLNKISDKEERLADLEALKNSYEEVLGLQNHPRLNKEAISHIFGRGNVKKALSQPIYRRINLSEGEKWGVLVLSVADVPEEELVYTVEELADVEAQIQAEAASQPGPSYRRTYDPVQAKREQEERRKAEEEERKKNFSLRSFARTTQRIQVPTVANTTPSVSNPFGGGSVTQVETRAQGREQSREQTRDVTREQSREQTRDVTREQSRDVTETTLESSSSSDEEEAPPIATGANWESYGDPKETTTSVTPAAAPPSSSGCSNQISQDWGPDAARNVARERTPTSQHQDVSSDYATSDDDEPEVKKTVRFSGDEDDGEEQRVRQANEKKRKERERRDAERAREEARLREIEEARLKKEQEEKARIEKEAEAARLKEEKARRKEEREERKKAESRKASAESSRGAAAETVEEHISSYHTQQPIIVPTPGDRLGIPLRTENMEEKRMRIETFTEAAVPSNVPPQNPDCLWDDSHVDNVGHNPEDSDGFKSNVVTVQGEVPLVMQNSRARPQMPNEVHPLHLQERQREAELHHQRKREQEEQKERERLALKSGGLEGNRTVDMFGGGGGRNPAFFGGPVQAPPAHSRGTRPTTFDSNPFKKVQQSQQARPAAYREEQQPIQRNYDEEEARRVQDKLVLEQQRRQAEENELRRQQHLLYRNASNEQTDWDRQPAGSVEANGNGGYYTSDRERDRERYESSVAAAPPLPVASSRLVDAHHKEIVDFERPPSAFSHVAPDDHSLHRGVPPRRDEYSREQQPYGNDGRFNRSRTSGTRSGGTSAYQQPPQPRGTPPVSLYDDRQINQNQYSSNTVSRADSLPYHSMDARSSEHVRVRQADGVSCDDQPPYQSTYPAVPRDPPPPQLGSVRSGAHDPYQVHAYTQSEAIDVILEELDVVTSNPALINDDAIQFRQFIRHYVYQYRTKSGAPKRYWTTMREGISMDPRQIFGADWINEIRRTLPEIKIAEIDDDYLFAWDANAGHR